MSGGKALIALAFAISVGVLAVIVATLYLDRRTVAPQGVAVVEAPPPIPTKEVVVLARPLREFSVIEPADLKKVAVPLYALPPNHVADPAQLVGRRVSVTLKPDEPVLMDHLVPRELDIELAGLMVDGFRAVSIAITEAGGVSGFVLPGNRVDVLLSGTVAEGKAFSRVLLQDIKVLAVAQDRVVADRTSARPVNLVTLEVTPVQAEMLEMARSVGTVSFALRAQSDRSTAITLGARQEELHGSKRVIEVIRGSTRSFE